MKVLETKQMLSSISYSNRWTDGANQPRDWYLLETLCQLPTRQLDKIVSSDRIPI